MNNKIYNNRIGILLVNLGTPSSTSLKDIKRYLLSFLSDKRVVEIPSFIWKIILHCFVLRLRPRKLQKSYEKIWMKDGSPLYVYTKKQALEIEKILLCDCINVKIEACMRYGIPSIEDGIKKLIRSSCKKILLFPLFPQYSSSTSGSIIEYTTSLLSKMRDIPDFRFVKKFNLSKGYIDSLSENINSYWKLNNKPDKLIVSFHSLPKSFIEKGDPYYDDCVDTFNFLVKKINLEHQKIYLGFQSKFGYSKWLCPSVSDLVLDFAKNGTKRIDIVCPGFISDCLETLEEIDIQYRNLFLSSGGQEFHYIKSLNDNKKWINGLENIIRAHIYDWV